MSARASASAMAGGAQARPRQLDQHLRQVPSRLELLPVAGRRDAPHAEVRPSGRADRGVPRDRRPRAHLLHRRLVGARCGDTPRMVRAPRRWRHRRNQLGRQRQAGGSQAERLVAVHVPQRRLSRSDAAPNGRDLPALPDGRPVVRHHRRAALLLRELPPRDGGWRLRRGRPRSRLPVWHGQVAPLLRRMQESPLSLSSRSDRLFQRHDDPPPRHAWPQRESSTVRRQLAARARGPAHHLGRL